MGQLSVAYDVTPRVTGATGVARYVTEIDRGLTARGVDLRRFAIGRARHRPPPDARWARVPLRVAHAAWRRGWGGPDRFVRGVDLVHATDLVPPPARVPLVLTIHDLLALDLPDRHPDRARRIQQATLDRLDRVAVVVVPSRATADAVRARAPAGTSVVVTPLAGADLPAPAAVVPPPGPVALHVGGLVGRKDLVTAVRAVAAAATPIHLVLVGPDGPARADVESEAIRRRVRDRVHLVGPVDDATLAGWYAAADVVVTTTRGEGFGLPVLEALRAGAPVVASDLPVLREIGGDLVAWARVGDADAIAAAIDAAVTDGGGAEAAERRRDHAARFTWDATAVATLGAYRQAVA